MLYIQLLGEQLHNSAFLKFFDQCTDLQNEQFLFGKDVVRIKNHKQLRLFKAYILMETYLSNV